MKSEIENVPDGNLRIGQRQRAYNQPARIEKIRHSNTTKNHILSHTNDTHLRKQNWIKLYDMMSTGTNRAISITAKKRVCTAMFSYVLFFLIFNRRTKNRKNADRFMLMPRFSVCLR